MGGAAAREAAGRGFRAARGIPASASTLTRALRAAASPARGRGHGASTPDGVTNDESPTWSSPAAAAWRRRRCATFDLHETERGSHGGPHRLLVRDGGAGAARSAP